jgi:MIP family channel proteins
VTDTIEQPPAPDPASRPRRSISITVPEVSLSDRGRQLLAEAVGTFLLVFVAAGTVLTQVVSRDSSWVAPALAYGFVVAALITALGHISGGHFNPAVTAGYLVTRRITPALAVAYIVVQAVAAVAAALVLRVVYGQGVSSFAHLGTPAVGYPDAAQAAVLEGVLTFALVLVVFAVSIDRRGTWASLAGLPAGLTVAAAVLMAGPLTGGALNPARWFGPALVNGDWSDAWVYLVGPFLGGALGALVYDLLLLRGSPGEPPAVEA